MKWESTVAEGMKEKNKEGLSCSVHKVLPIFIFSPAKNLEVPITYL